MRPVVKSERWDIATRNPLEVHPYGDAKPDLILELGSFCSFCEKKLTRSALQVEHIYAKSLPHYAHLINRWDNFLLGCNNCNSVKGIKDVVALQPYMPHESNLLCFIEIRQGGVIAIKVGVIGTDYDRTNEFIELVGLDRNPSHPMYSDKDDRYEYRMETYDIAKRQFQKYTNSRPGTDIENIIKLAKGYGFFSVWFTIFEGYPEVKKALLEAFAGTATTCFDHTIPPKGCYSVFSRKKLLPSFNPIPRNQNDL